MGCVVIQFGEFKENISLLNKINATITKIPIGIVM